MVASKSLAAVRSGSNNEADDLSKALDILEAFVGYFDGKGPIWQRAQIATRNLLAAREMLRASCLAKSS